MSVLNYGLLATVFIISMLWVLSTVIPCIPSCCCRIASLLGKCTVMLMAGGLSQTCGWIDGPCKSSLTWTLQAEWPSAMDDSYKASHQPRDRHLSRHKWTLCSQYSLNTMHYITGFWKVYNQCKTSINNHKHYIIS